MHRRSFALVALLALVGCEPEEQLLPFDVTASTSRTVGASGGTVSSPAGAAIHFAEGSLPGSVEVTIAPETPPAEVASAGASVSEGFHVSPEGVTLGEPALLELAFAAGDDPARAWLATVVGVAEGLLRPYGSTRVDLAAGRVESEVGTLGSFAVVIPSPGLVYPVTAVGSGPAFSLAALSHGATHGVSVFCGGPATPCTGISATASENLLERVEEAALLYPAVTGGFTITGVTATGAVDASATVRVLLESEVTAESVGIEARVETTAGTTVTETADRLVLSNVRATVSGGEDTETHVEMTDLVIRKSGGAGVLSVGRSFQIDGDAGVETASVSIEIPVDLEF